MMDVVSPRPRIVVADDHAEMRKRVAGLLAEQFDVVASVGDGQQAVEAAETLRPDVVVLDMSMPVLNGVQAAVRIRRLPHVPRILFMTAIDDQAIAAALLSFGASTLVLKRDLLDELVPAVRHALATPYTHGICLYADSASLCQTAARFVGGGLAIDQPGILLVTRAHRDIIMDLLAEMHIDARERIARDDLAILDAHEVMASGAPEEMGAVFGQLVLPVVEKLRRGGEKFPRLYGEVGGLLWAAGHEAATLKLEETWNQLDVSRRISVLCGYLGEAVGDGAGFKKLCYHHDEVVTAA